MIEFTDEDIDERIAQIEEQIARNNFYIFVLHYTDGFTWDQTMMTPEEKAESDQALANLADTFPSTCWRLYKNNIDEGFTKEQSMELVKTWLTSMMRPGGS